MIVGPIDPSEFLINFFEHCPIDGRGGEVSIALTVLSGNIEESGDIDRFERNRISVLLEQVANLLSILIDRFAFVTELREKLLSNRAVSGKNLVDERTQLLDRDTPKDGFNTLALIFCRVACDSEEHRDDVFTVVMAVVWTGTLSLETSATEFDSHVVRVRSADNS